MSEYINNQTLREERLKSIIRKLHEGQSADEVKAAFADMLADVGPDEIVRIEAALVNEGLDPAEIEPLCDVHVAIFQDSLDTQKPPETMPGHPVFTFRAENLGVQRVLDEVAEALDDYVALPRASTLSLAQKAVARLHEYDKHYLRKENLLFPFLEQKGFLGPTQVMWGVHDEIRDMWKTLAAALEVTPDTDVVPSNLRSTFDKLAETIRSMVYKEEHILFPAALQRLTDAEWLAVRDQGDEIGYSYARPGRVWVPGAVTKAELHGELAPSPSVPAGLQGGIPLSVGLLTAEQIDLMLRSLPVDVTFVDENDEVRYFPQGRERIFQRSPAIIGRKVQNCHPPQSVDKVQRIVEDFRAGKRDVAEFWIQMSQAGVPLFVHIRYFALRDASGAYRGTLEVSQNLTPLRALEGERRLLDD